MFNKDIPKELRSSSYVLLLFKIDTFKSQKSRQISYSYLYIILYVEIMFDFLSIIIDIPSTALYFSISLVSVRS